MIKIVHTEIRGTLHVANDIPCQDKISYMTNDRSSCIALADGAGSCRLSHIGAQICVDQVCKYFNENDALESTEFLEQLRGALIDSGYPINALSSTLLFVYINNSNTVTVGHIGDGMIIECFDGKGSVVSFPENGSESNITFFTTDDNVEKHFRVKSFEIPNDDYTVFLMSDGGAELFYNNKTNTVATAVDKISQWIKDESEDDVNNALKINLTEMAKLSTSDDVSLVGLRISKDVSK